MLSVRSSRGFPHNKQGGEGTRVGRRGGPERCKELRNVTLPPTPTPHTQHVVSVPRSSRRRGMLFTTAPRGPREGASPSRPVTGCTLRERKVVIHGAPSGPVHGPDSRSRRYWVSRGSCLSRLTRPTGRLDRCGTTVGLLVDGGRSSASVFVRCLLEVRRSRSREHDQRVRVQRLLLAVD